MKYSILIYSFEDPVRLVMITHFTNQVQRGKIIFSRLHIAQGLTGGRSVKMNETEVMRLDPRSYVKQHPGGYF